MSLFVGSRMLRALALVFGMQLVWTPGGAVAQPAPSTNLCEELGTSYAGDGPCEEWVYLSPARSDRPDAIPQRLLPDPEGRRVYLTGIVEEEELHPNYPNRLHDIQTVALDPSSGAVVWEAIYTGEVSGQDEVATMVLSPDGERLYVVGGGVDDRGMEEGWFDFVTIAYEASTGEEIWVRRHRQSEQSIDQAYHVAVSPDGSRLYVGGYTNDEGRRDGGDVMVVEYDADSGSVVSEWRYDGIVGYSDFLDAMAMSPDGTRLYLAVTSWEPSTLEGYIDMNIVTLAYDLERENELLWKRSWNGPAENHDRPRLAVATDDAVVISGFSGPVTDLDIATVAYGGDGELLWESVVGFTWGDVPRGLVASPEGDRVYVAGELVPEFPNNRADYWTASYEVATGAEVWSRVDSYHGRWHTNQPDEPTAMAISPDGTTLAVTGTSIASGTGWDMWTLLLEAQDGERLAGARYDGLLLTDRARAVTFSRDGSSLYVAGTTERGPEGADQRAVVVAYPTAGEPFPSVRAHVESQTDHSLGPLPHVPGRSDPLGHWVRAWG